MLKLVDPINEPEFDPWEAFWLLYPRHVAKKDALKAWNKIDADQHPAILTALYHWRRVWKEKDAQYIPHPASWLNGERWDDELPDGAAPLHASHAAAAIPEPGKRTEMPQFVKDMIQRMKKG